MNPIANRPQDINAQMAAVELSYDRDWARFRASFFWASGDGNANNRHATGFDSIHDNPNFAGGEFSFWQRQNIPLFGVNLVQRQSLVPDLRSSKIQGQANFVNPGLQLFNVGMDMDLTPKLRMINNANFLFFDKTNSLETFLFDGQHRSRDRRGPVDGVRVPAVLVEQRDLQVRRRRPDPGPRVQRDLQSAGSGREPVGLGVYRNKSVVLRMIVTPRVRVQRGPRSTAALRKASGPRRNISYFIPSTFTKNAHWSATSSISFAVGLPAPWPARVSIRASTGAVPAWQSCSSRDELEAVARHHAVVRVRRRHQRRRVLRARLQVVIRRIGVQRLELVGVVGRAVVVDPEAAGGELLEPQHVHDADGRQARPEQVGPLRHHGADQQAAVAAALDRQLLRARCTCLAISHSAAAMKSSKTFCFLSLVPAWCHSSPYSPPPRRFAWA